MSRAGRQRSRKRVTLGQAIRVGGEFVRVKAGHDLQVTHVTAKCWRKSRLYTTRITRVTCGKSTVTKTDHACHVQVVEDHENA